jgi:diguanylate cyclase (GGDEF)-like protein
MVDDRSLSSVLSEFAATLAIEFPIAAILDHLVERIVEILPVTSAGVTLIEPDGVPRYVAASNAAALRYEQLQSDVSEGPCLLAYESGKLVSVPDLALETRFPRFTSAALEAGLAAVFTFPLHQGERRLGALDLYRETSGGLDPAGVEAALTLASVAAAYLLNAWAHEEARASADQLRLMATHDDMTGLPNRKLLLQRIEHAGRLASRSQAPAAVLFVDLDEFKKVNDLHGHDVGDRLLIAVAHRLSEVVRPGDTLARLYGDEFVLLCENIAATDTRLVAQRLHDAFSRPFDAGDHKITVSASIGIAFAGPGNEVTGDLVAKADQAMYDAKRQGASAVLDLR